MSVFTVRKLKSRFSEFMDRLPDDIKQMIYYDHFDIIIKYERVMKIFIRTRDLTCKSSRILARYVEKILKDEKLKNYLLCHSTSFKNHYNYDNNFENYDSLSNIYERFALGWMWQEYH